MNCKIFLKKLRLPALVLAVLALAAAAPSFAQTTVDLCATTGSVTMPDTTVVPIWGYADITGGGDCTTAVATLPGPEIRATAGETLTINLTNNLSQAVSFFVPGLRAATVPATPGFFTGEVAASSSGSYTFDLTGRSGTFPYHSATSKIRTQVPMGLYGALVVDSGVNEAYPGVSYDQDEVLVFSEIDPNLNADPAGYDGAKVINWNPQYFLINGQAHPATAHIAFGTGDNVLLRFVNAGLDSVMPTLEGGLYMDLVAEDANLYPHSMSQYGIELPAGKTIDALVTVAADGTYALYDRGLNLTNGGMLTYLDVSTGAGIFQLGSSTYSVAENVAGGILTITVDRVGGSAGAVSVDYATADGTATAGSDYTAIPTTTLNFADMQTSATFDVTILDDGTYEGDETFNVSLSNATGGATLGTPESAVVTITEDDPGPGTLQLSAATYSVAENVAGGILTITVDRVGGSAGAVSVDYATADGTATAGSDYTAIPVTTLNIGDGVTSETFDITILDDTTYEGDETFGVILSNAVGATLGTPSSAEVTITEDDPAPNVAPIANPDVTSTPRNTPLVINIDPDIIANDDDGEGNTGSPWIDATSVVITTGGTTQRGGTVTNNGDGTITYTTPNPGFRGTDTFQYTVEDDPNGTPSDHDGLTSGPATVSINVVR